MPPFRWLFFDATNTLFGLRTSAGDHYAAVASKLFNLRLNSQLIEDQFKINWKQFNEVMPNFGLSSGITAKEWWHRIVKETLVKSNLTSEPQIDAIFEQLWIDYQLPKSWFVFPEVRWTLSALRNKQIGLGIISNFDQRLECVLNQLSLRQYFDVIITSVEACHAKPDIGIFNYALQQLQDITANQCAYIGDNIDLDYYPARQIGMAAFLIQRHNQVSANKMNDNYNKSFNKYTLHRLDDILQHL